MLNTGFNSNAVLHMGLIWILVVFYLCFIILCQMIKSYVKSKTGELSVVITMTSIALIISMLCLITDKYMDFGLNESFQTFDSNLKLFMEENMKNLKIKIEGPSSIIFNGCLAISSTLIASLLTFPGLKQAQMFSFLYKRPENTSSSVKNLILQVIAVINFSLPFLVTLPRRDGKEEVA